MCKNKLNSIVVKLGIFFMFLHDHSSNIIKVIIIKSTISTVSADLRSPVKKKTFFNTVVPVSWCVAYIIPSPKVTNCRAIIK